MFANTGDTLARKCNNARLILFDCWLVYVLALIWLFRSNVNLSEHSYVRVKCWFGYGLHCRPEVRPVAYLASLGTNSDCGLRDCGLTFPLNQTCYTEDGIHISAAGNFKPPPPTDACCIGVNNVFAGFKKGRMKLDRQVLAYSCMHVEVPASI